MMIGKLRANSIRLMGRWFRGNEVLFLDVPNFDDMKNTFGCYFSESCFMEDVPYGFWGELRIARAAVIVSACGAAKRVFSVDAKRIELWHASGAIKKIDNKSYWGIDADYVISAPSKVMVKAYAEYFNVAEEHVKPLGVPKTDLFFDDSIKRDVISRFHLKYPQLKDKRIYLFSPTFRGEWPESVSYKVGLRFLRIAALLKDDEVLLVKLHPSLSDYGGRHNVDFIGGKVIDFSDSDITSLLMVCDVLVSDYSSIIYDAALLNKPMVIYAEDIDEYAAGRGLSDDYRCAMPCPILEKPDEKEFVNLLRCGELDSNAYRVFMAKYVGACDGEATGRVLEEISYMLGESYKNSKSYIGD